MSRNKLEVPESGQQMEKLKWEVAEELELDDDIKEKGYANMIHWRIDKNCGNMVMKMEANAETK